ncbi:hypothetical protein BGZ81_009987 [Podila clonocystis]|nr:hypothetical protein BGZ81_009987 [Podila clonocystis]
MKRSRVTMARTVLLMCITFAAMALAHLHFANTLRHERDVERERQLQHQHDEYIAHNQPIAHTANLTTIQNNDPIPTNNGNDKVNNDNNTDMKTEREKTPDFTVVQDTDLTTTVRYTNSTVLKTFKPAFYRDKNKAKKEMGSFMQTLASRSWLKTSVVSSFSTEDSSEQDDEEEDDNADAAQGLQPSDTFLAYLPMGGGNNQFTTLQKAALLAKDLNRTLLLPPVSPSSHIKTWSGVRYSDFYNLAAFTAQSGIPVLEWADVKQTPSDPPKQLTNHWADFAEDMPCTPNGGIGVDNKNLYDHFRTQFLLNFKATVPKEDTTLGTATEYEFARDVLLKDSDDGKEKDKKPEMWKCLSSPYFLVGPEVSDRSWAEVGLHLRFNSRIEGMVDEILDKLIGTVPSAPSSSSVSLEVKPTRRHPEFIIVHLRRGDIVNKCKPGVPESECIVQIEQIAEKVDEIEKKRRIQALSGLSDSDAKDNKESEKQVLQRLPVLVTTNEKRPEELRKLEKLGWIMLDHGDVAYDAQGNVVESKTTKLGTFSALGPYWPPMLDAVLLTRGNYLIGMRNSRMSKLAAQRGAAWHGHTTMLM